MKSFFKPLAAVAALALLAFAGQASAAGTPSGVSISNTANLSFTVSGVLQPNATATAPSFLVDSKISMTMAPAGGVGSVVTVIPGSTRQVIPFIVTNTGNVVADYILFYAAASTGAVYGSPTSYTDAFDGTACSMYADVNNNGVYDAATDTRTYIDELAPDASTRAFVVCDIPSGRVNGEASVVRPTIRVAAGGNANNQGSPLINTTGPKSLSTVAVVLADAAGTDDVAYDGFISARGAYVVQTSALSVTKSVVAYCDPTNFSSNPKLIPGAFARYTITISNAASAGASATLSQVVDPLSSRLAMDPDLINATAASCSTPTSAAGKGIRVSCTGGTRACVATPTFLDTATYYTPGLLNITGAGALPAEAGYAAGEVKPGESVTVIFNAIVQ